MKRTAERPTPQDVEKEDEVAVRAYAAAHKGSIEISDKVIELNFPEDVVVNHIKGKNFMASNWHNLRAVAMNEGRVILG